MEYPVSILETSIRMAQRRCSRIGSDCLIKGIEDQRIVVAVTDHMCDDPPVIEIEDRTQIHFMLVIVFIIPSEFSDICQPFFVWFISCEFPVQYVLSNKLWIICPACAPVIRVLNCRFYVPGPADSQHTLVIDLDVVPAVQVVINSPVSFGWIVPVYFLYLFGYDSVVSDPFSDIAAQPLVIRCS